MELSMAEEHALVVETTDGPAQTAAAEDELEKKREKKRAKVRSAWISFVGRIVAQIMGAVATISLGLMLVQKYHARAGRAARGHSGQARHAR
jgi:hypothetical protein